ncbi:MAG: GDYXXLXY domain-containing protein [Campylobacteraceae bacterium]|jgi:uncharacterized membrane-anchored protein|nr:GDYXXLXY domain-containing protein [Campylobacteraceae bacterium]
MRKLKRFFYPAFFALVVIQIAALLYQIINYERILHFGDVLTLEVVPKDPYDAFRGRYVTLGFKDDSIKTDKYFDESGSYYYNKDFFITFDNSGKFSVADDVFDEKPKTDKPYWKVKGYALESAQAWEEEENTINMVHFEYPFDRFYMQENLAKYVDGYGWGFWGEYEAYAKVRVKNGKGVIEDVFVEDMPIGDFVKNSQHKIDY